MLNNLLDFKSSPRNGIQIQSPNSNGAVIVFTRCDSLDFLVSSIPSGFTLSASSSTKLLEPRGKRFDGYIAFRTEFSFLSSLYSLDTNPLWDEYLENFSPIVYHVCLPTLHFSLLYERFLVP